MIARVFAAGIFGLLLTACAQTELPDEMPDMGTFRLGHNIIVADSAVKSPVSREATPEEWEEALFTAIDDRLDSYLGQGLFHIGVTVQGYALAPPGIPLVASPKSVLILAVNVWDDSQAKKLTEEAHQITVFENVDGDTVIGSGLTKTKDQQIETLSFNAAMRIQDWLIENKDTWLITTSDRIVDDPEEAVAKVEETSEQALSADQMEALATLPRPAVRPVRDQIVPDEAEDLETPAVQTEVPQLNTQDTLTATDS